ncbi:MAG: response regulator [Chloroflexota bacterium]|nr:response regulator [Chloroflexota bacterium]
MTLPAPPLLLIVDDDPTMLALLAHLLAEFMPAATVHSAASAAAALYRVVVNDYDAILSDIAMPEMDGLALLTAVRTVRPDTPTVLMTALDDQQVVMRALRAGAFDFLTKPVNPDYLVGALARAVELRRLRRQVAAHAVAAQLHAARQASEWAAVLEAIPDGIYICDQTGQLTSVNGRGAQILGLSVDQALRPLAAYVPTNMIRYLDGSLMALADYPLACALRGETATDYRLIIRPTGSEQNIYVRCSHGPIRDKAGAISGAVAVLSDISELYRLEQQRRQFLAVASHELRTPITTIKAGLQLAVRRLTRADQLDAVGLLGRVDRQVDRLTALVGDLLAVERLQNGGLALHAVRFDLAALLHQVAETMQTTTERHAIMVQAPPALLLLGDAHRLEQVFTNLIGNAIKYSPAGGPITIALRADAGAAEVCVQDVGIGVPETDQARIFEQFGRAANAAAQQISGFGLGLFISQAIVQAHNGRLWLDTTHSGPGSVFCVSLPLEEETDA